MRLRRFRRMPAAGTGGRATNRPCAGPAPDEPAPRPADLGRKAPAGKAPARSRPVDRRGSWADAEHAKCIVLDSSDRFSVTSMSHLNCSASPVLACSAALRQGTRPEDTGRCSARPGKPPPGQRSRLLRIPECCRTPFSQVRHYPKGMSAGQERVNGRALRRPRGMPGGPKGVIARAFYRRMVHETGKGVPQLLAAQAQEQPEV